MNVCVYVYPGWFAPFQTKFVKFVSQWLTYWKRRLSAMATSHSRPGDPGYAGGVEVVMGEVEDEDQVVNPGLRC